MQLSAVVGAAGVHAGGGRGGTTGLLIADDLERGQPTMVAVGIVPPVQLFLHLLGQMGDATYQILQMVSAA